MVPRIAAPAAKTSTVSARLSPAEAEILDQARGGLTRSAWIETLIRAELQRFTRAQPPREGDCPHPPRRVIKGFCYACGSMTSV